MTDVIISSAAEGDYTEALLWYAERSVRVADRFDLEFDRAIQIVASDPESFPRCDDRHRYYLMRRFPYQIIYRPHDDYLVVIAVAHASREPQFWANR